MITKQKDNKESETKKTSKFPNIVKSHWWDSTLSITNGHLLFVMGALILWRVQKCEVGQVTKDVVKSEV